MSLPLIDLRAKITAEAASVLQNILQREGITGASQGIGGK